MCSEKVDLLFPLLRAGMDESTFETFEEELGTPLQEVPPPKPIRQARRSGTREKKTCHLNN